MYTWASVSELNVVFIDVLLFGFEVVSEAWVQLSGDECVANEKTVPELSAYATPRMPEFDIENLGKDQ